MIHYNRLFCAIAVLLMLCFAVSCSGVQSLDPEIAPEVLVSTMSPSAEYDEDVFTFGDKDVPMSELPDETSPIVTKEDDGAVQVLVETTNGSTTVSGKILPDEALALLELINRERAAAGLPELEFDPYLESSAIIRSAEASVTWSHTRPNGSAWNTVAKDLGGENLGSGYKSADSVINGWMNSEMHKSIVLYPSFTRAAASAFKSGNGRLFWAMHFGV